MRNLSKKVLVVLIVGLLGGLGALLVGCGSKQSSAPTTSDQAKSVKKYSVATEAAFAPFEMRDTETNEYVGFDMDLIRAIGKVEGFEPEIKDMGFDGIIAAVKTGNVDMAISAITIKPDRQKEVDFSIPYYQSGLSIAVSKDNNTIKSFEDLKGKRIAVQIGTTGADMAKTIPGATIKTFDHVTEALMEIKNGGADALVNDLPVSAYYIKQNGGKDFKLVGELLSTEFYGIAVPKDKPEIKKMIDDGLMKLKESGEYARIYEKWFGEKPPEFLPGEPKK